MKTEKELEILERIKKVDAPPFLYTRIEQKMKNYRVDYISKKSLVFSFAVLSVILIVNLTVIINKFTKNTENKSELIIEKFELIKSNNIYL